MALRSTEIQAITVFSCPGLLRALECLLLSQYIVIAGTTYSKTKVADSDTRHVSAPWVSYTTSL